MGKFNTVILLFCLGLCSISHSASVKSASATKPKDPYHPVEQWLEAFDDPIEPPESVPPPKGAEEWRRMAQESLAKALARENLNRNVAKNVIIFIGDGMGITTTSAARLLLGEERDPEGYGEEGYLSFEKFPHMALSKTYNSDWQVPDSAGSATAILCGVKAKFSTIGVDDTAIHQVCDSQEWSSVDSIVYWAEAQGMSTGVVTNTAVTHATPAAAYANAASRVWECDADMPLRENCSDIAMQLIERGHDIEVVMGGGRSKFFGVLMEDPAEPGQTGSRRDGRNLIEEWEEDKEEKGKGHAVVYTAQELSDIDVENTDYLFGLFKRGHMSYDRERGEEEPALMDMVEKAIQILQKDQDGYFLMVEGGRIDMGHHASRAKRALTDTIAFSDAVEMAVNMTNEEDTLIIVTADHSHVMAFAGYHVKGTPILDKGIYPARDFMPYTKILYGNGAGYDFNASDRGRENIRDIDTTDNSYVYQSAVPMDSETHGGEDVGIYARGPMAHLIQGVQEQHYIAHVAGYASCTGDNLEHCLEGKECDEIPDRFKKLMQICEYAPAAPPSGDAGMAYFNAALLLFAALATVLVDLMK